MGPILGRRIREYIFLRIGAAFSISAFSSSISLDELFVRSFNFSNVICVRMEYKSIIQL